MQQPVSLRPDQVHSAFEWVRSQPIDSLNLVVEEYQHKKTGAVHYHLHSDNPENVFLVGLRTVPTDSTGVAHILEHTALCGSEKYPVRDPFFMMIRRSLNTFMNAFTSSDWTAYPFASQNRKDFDNLLEVYLDAVFFSRLHELDFAQEGHRVEFAEADNPDSELVYKGVVYNEMKGAMSSPVSTLWQTFTKYLFPTTTYHFNSGGEPMDIPDLSYEDLKAFYEVHYHPSNAVFMTYGDIPAIEHHERFETLALSRFEKLDRTIEVTDEKRYFAPVNVEEHYALDSDEDVNAKSHLVMGWLLGHSIELEPQFKAHLLASVLLDNSASPLMQALETTDLGASPSPLCGLEESNREMSFMCGLEGAKAENAPAFEKLVMDVLHKVAKEGVPQEQLEAALHQLELSQREITGDSFPYGLQLIMTGLSTAVHRGNVIDMLNLDPVLEKLREEIKQPDFIQNLIHELLLDNPHRVRLTLIPDVKLSERRQQAEAARLLKKKMAMSEEEKQRVIEQTKALEARQTQEDDLSILPKVGIDDVPDFLPIPEGELADEQTHTTYFSAGTNGLVYQQVVIDLPTLEQEYLDVLPLYADCLNEVGIGDKNYLQVQMQQSAVTGGMSAFYMSRGAVDNEQQVAAYFVLSGKALYRNAAALNDLIRETFDDVRFDELPRIRELIAQRRTRKERSVTGSGHGLAMQAASSGLSPIARLNHQLKGLASIKTIKALDDSLNDENNLKALCERFKALHQIIQRAPRRFLLIGEEEHKDELTSLVKASWADNKAEPMQPFALPETRTQSRQIWTTSTDVNFCAKAYPTVPVDHPDSAALTVLGGFLRNGILHRTIREQGGAYGGGAMQDSIVAAFKFFSYRDPRLEGTLNDFDAAIEWLLANEHDDEKLEEAVLGVVSSIDKPGSPAGDAKQAYHNALFGRTPEQRRAFRSRVLEVSMADLKRVAETYLKPELASIAVVTNGKMAESFDTQGFDVIKL